MESPHYYTFLKHQYVIPGHHKQVKTHFFYLEGLESGGGGMGVRGDGGELVFICVSQKSLDHILRKIVIRIRGQKINLHINIPNLILVCFDCDTSVRVKCEL